jgi:hypothetical protein
MTKLSIKAKAFKEDSSELTEILNTVVGVLKAAANATKVVDQGGTSFLKLVITKFSSPPYYPIDVDG